MRWTLYFKSKSGNFLRTVTGLDKESIVYFFEAVSRKQGREKVVEVEGLIYLKTRRSEFLALGEEEGCLLFAELAEEVAGEER